MFAKESKSMKAGKLAAAQNGCIAAGVFQRHQPQIAGHLLAAMKPIRIPDDQHERQRGQRTHSGMIS